MGGITYLVECLLSYTTASEEANVWKDRCLLHISLTSGAMMLVQGTTTSENMGRIVARILVWGGRLIIGSLGVLTLGVGGIIGVNKYYDEKRRRQISHDCTAHVEITNLMRIPASQIYSPLSVEICRLMWHLDIYPCQKAVSACLTLFLIAGSPYSQTLNFDCNLGAE